MEGVDEGQLLRAGVTFVVVVSIKHQRASQMLPANAQRFQELADREPTELDEEEERELQQLGEEVRGEIRAIFYTL